MSEVDEQLLTLSKLREVVDGDLDARVDLHPHAGPIEDDHHRNSLSFIESVTDDRFDQTKLGTQVLSKLNTDAATDAVTQNKHGLAANLTGVTETEFKGDNMTVALHLLEELHNNGAPFSAALAGDPNSGKTNTMAKLVDLLDRATAVDEIPDDVLVISNIRSWDRTDRVVTSMHKLMVTLLLHRNTPKVVVIDEASTHFDSRVYSYQVANQWTPAAKRFAKIGVYGVGLIVHSGKDFHPEAKRLTNLAAWKNEKKEVQFYKNWPAEADQPADSIFPDPVVDFEKATGYDPDDAAPWNWNLEPELFALDLDWDDLLDELRARGPATDN